MNISNITTENQVYTGVFGSIMVIGLPLNAASLWILLRRHSLKSPNTVFLVNLALSDLLVLISLSMRVYFHATGTWPLGIMACFFSMCSFATTSTPAPPFITFISVDRLLAVVYPLRSSHLRTSSNAWNGAAVIWLFVLMVNIPGSADFLKHFYNSSSITSSVYFQIVSLVTMLSVNIVCTAVVSWTLYKHLSDSAKVNKVNIMLIFAMNLVLFTICFLPVPIHLATRSTASVTPLICLAAVNCLLFHNNIRSSTTFIPAISVNHLLAVVSSLRSSMFKPCFPWELGVT
ncbi:lysophosphatidic acid receptor 6-like [Archocentrus centrarchus]|uniref:lysophosphatidic acid receptor 6-like n=1 Tax=Archocentrus centrarchus TaxID=63155 RepID=UPI0011E9EAFA|nr:lysophosphatidic acid receptor 6-like [Archocentrus centrarchus]